MTATEVLRRELDERGVEWKEHRHTLAGSMAIQRETLWGQPIDSTSGKTIPHVYHCRATEMGDGRLFLEAQLVTPEQAIAATVDAGTCRLKKGETTWFAEYNGYVTMWTCNECGGLTFSDAETRLRFCADCGRRVSW